jgi:hypothetical protein
MMVLDGQGRAWIAVPNHDCLIVVDLGPGVHISNATFKSVGFPKGSRPWSVALGPDGRMWCTLKGAESLARIDPGAVPGGPGAEAAVERFPVPGHACTDLVSAGDGRLYFLQEDGGLIGSIRALPVPAKAQPKLKVPKETKEPRKAGKTPMDAAPAKEETKVPVLEETAAFVPEEAKTPVAEETKAGVPGKAAVQPRHRKPEPTAASRNPYERLQAMGIILTPAVADAIFVKHRHDAQNGRSEFDPRYASGADLAQLIADGMEEAGEVARILSPAGSYLTVCRQAGVGRHKQFVPPGREPWYPVEQAPYFTDTDCFTVAAVPYFDTTTRTWSYLVKSAYPSRPDGE